MTTLEWSFTNGAQLKPSVSSGYRRTLFLVTKRISCPTAVSLNRSIALETMVMMFTQKLTKIEAKYDY